METDSNATRNGSSSCESVNDAITDDESGPPSIERRSCTPIGCVFGQSGTPAVMARQLFTNAPISVNTVGSLMLKRGPADCPSLIVNPPLPNTLKTVEADAEPSVSTSRIGSAQAFCGMT